jgi:hypothetical protein
MNVKGKIIILHGTHIDVCMYVYCSVNYTLKLIVQLQRFLLTLNYGYSRIVGNCDRSLQYFLTYCHVYEYIRDSDWNSSLFGSLSLNS